MKNSTSSVKVRLADQKKADPSELGSYPDQRDKVKSQQWGSPSPQQKVLTVYTTKGEFLEGCNSFIPL